MDTCGVITGDIVGFTKLTVNDRDKLIKTLNGIIDTYNDGIAPVMKIKFEVYRGDSFQVVIPEAENSLKVALLIRLGLISARTANYPSSLKPNIWDARLSIGIGTVDSARESISLSDGEAFHNSGRAFDLLKKSDRLIVRTPWEEINNELNVESFMADTIIRRLSEKQTEITYQYILGNSTQKSLAEELGITPQAVNKSLQQGGNALLEFIRRFEFLIKKQIV